MNDMASEDGALQQRPPEPPFWSQEVAAIPFCRQLVSHYAEILLELTELFLDRRPFMAFPEYGLYSAGWEAFPLSVYEGEFNDNVPACAHMDMSKLAHSMRASIPVLGRLISPLEQEGSLRNVFVSRLKPGTLIRPHKGWTKNFLRLHLGLLCDPGCKITVGPETRTWLPGELLAFKDGGPYFHSVTHEGSRDRVVLSLDLRFNYVEKFIPNIQTDQGSLVKTGAA